MVDKPVPVKDSDVKLLLVRIVKPLANELVLVLPIVREVPTPSVALEMIVTAVPEKLILVKPVLLKVVIVSL